MIDKERVKFILNKQQIKTIIIIFVVVFILAVFIDINMNPYPPRIVFVDKETNDFLDGTVFLDNENLGKTEEGVFKDLPDDFCGKEHQINLEVEGNKYSWKSHESDCELNYIIFTVEKEIILEQKTINIRFFIKENQEPLEGDLYFDNEFIEYVEGQYSIDKNVCDGLDVIVLETEQGNIEWKHHASWCEGYDIIDYSISEEELSSLE